MKELKIHKDGNVITGDMKRYIVANLGVSSVIKSMISESVNFLLVAGLTRSCLLRITAFRALAALVPVVRT